MKEVPEGERDEWTVLVAHEFFDALPVHVFEVRPSLPPSLPFTFRVMSKGKTRT